MSHFNVMVMTNDDSLDLNELLAPYDESLTRAPWIEFTRQEAIDFARENFVKLADKPDEECWAFMSEDCITDKAGNIYSTSNPDAKWDWWQIGGSWKNFLRLKDGMRANHAKIKDIDFGLDKEAYEKALRFWDLVVEHKPLEPDEKAPFSLWNEDYYRDNYGDRESYARSQASFHTQAVVLPNGLWCECGNVGWWGFSDETAAEARNWEKDFVDRFIAGEDENTVITIVDCHI